MNGPSSESLMEQGTAVPIPPAAVDYPTLAPTSCLRARRERGGLVIELLPPGFRDSPGLLAAFVVPCGLPILAGAGRILWLLRAKTLPLSAWGSVVGGAEWGGTAGLILLGLAGLPYFAVLAAIAWRGRSHSGPAVFHLTDDGWIAKRHGPRQCWGVHRANVVGVERHWGRVCLRMRAGHTLNVTGGASRRRRDLDWLEATFQRYVDGSSGEGREDSIHTPAR